MPTVPWLMKRRLSAQTDDGLSLACAKESGWFGSRTAQAEYGTIPRANARPVKNKEGADCAAAPPTMDGSN
jgi:hypothetical protein